MWASLDHRKKMKAEHSRLIPQACRKARAFNCPSFGCQTFCLRRSLYLKCDKSDVSKAQHSFHQTNNE